MGNSWHFAPLLLCLALISIPDKATAIENSAVQAAFDDLVRAAKDHAWQAEVAISQELASMGKEALPKLVEAARTHEDARVRRDCFRILTGPLSSEEQAIDTVISHGLQDREPGIRYESAFYLGTLKVARAEQALRKAFEDSTVRGDSSLRFTIAKSLAELGKADVLPTLYLAISNDAATIRDKGNIGLKALTGKSLEDFLGYKYAEGTGIIGGMEFSTTLDPIACCEMSEKRFQAAVAYFKWLKAERPELYAQGFPSTKQLRDLRRRKLKESAHTVDIQK